MLQLGKVHEYKRMRDGSQAILTNVDPVTRLGHKVEGLDIIYVFIQHGEFYSEDGKVIPRKNLPSWLDTEIAKMSPEARKEVGLIDWKPAQEEDD